MMKSNDLILRKKTLKKQFFDLISSNLLDKFANGLNVFILISWFGLNGFGIWSVLFSILLIIDSFLSFGVSTYALEFFVQNRFKSKKGIANLSIIIVIFKITFLIFSLSLINTSYINQIGGKITLINLTCFLILQELAKTFESFIQFNGLTYIILISRSAQSIFRTVAVFLSYLFSLPNYFASISYLTSMILCCSTLFYLWKVESSRRNRNPIKKETFKLFIFSVIKVFKGSIPFTISSLAILLYLKSDLICLKYFSIEDSLIGKYSLASSIAVTFYFIPINGYKVLLGSFNGENLGEILKKFKSKIFTTCFSIFLLLELLYFFIRFLHNEFSLFSVIIYETANLLSILSIGLLGVWLIEYGALFFAANNKNWFLNSRSLITFINNISLNLILIPKYGVYGAALGTTSAFILTGFIVLFLKKNLEKEY